jgi:hypothetical protein
MSNQSQLRTGRIWLAAGVLAAVSGALLTSGCRARDEVDVASASEVRAEARAAGATSGDYMKQQLTDLQSRAAEAQRGAKEEIDQAQAKAEDFPVAAREKLTVAIERTESAREDVRARLDELEHAGNAGWDASRQRVVDALEELAEARHDVVAAFAGGDPTLSDG